MIAEPLPDFERLRFSTRPLDALAARPSKPPRHRQGEAFLKGPIPMPWLALAARLPGRALHMGLVLWYWAGITKQRVVAPSLSRAEREFGVSRTALARGLAALEHADLVSVDRRAGRKPVVTLLDPPRSRKTSGNIGSEPKALVPSDLSAPDVRPDVGENIGTHREPSDRSADQIDEFPQPGHHPIHNLSASEASWLTRAGITVTPGRYDLPGRPAPKRRHPSWRQ